MSDHRVLAYTLLRATVGVMFLFFGIGKLLGGVGAFAGGLQERFADSVLPSALVTGFGTVLPFLEVLLGALLLPGLFTGAALGAAGVLILILTFGTVIEPDPASVADNVNYALVIAGLLWLVEYDRLSLDAWRRRRSGGDGRAGFQATTG